MGDELGYSANKIKNTILIPSSWIASPTWTLKLIVESTGFTSEDGEVVIWRLVGIVNYLVLGTSDYTLKQFEEEEWSINSKERSYLQSFTHTLTAEVATIQKKKKKTATSDAMFV